MITWNYGTMFSNEKCQMGFSSSHNTRLFNIEKTYLCLSERRKRCTVHLVFLALCMILDIITFRPECCLTVFAENTFFIVRNFCDPVLAYVILQPLISKLLCVCSLLNFLSHVCLENSSPWYSNNCGSDGWVMHTERTPSLAVQGRRGDRILTQKKTCQENLWLRVRLLPHPLSSLPLSPPAITTATASHPS